MRARTRGRAHARDGLDKKRGVPGGGPHPPTWSRTRGWDLAESRAALRRPVAVWGHLAPREPSGPLSGVLWPSGPLSGVLWPFGGIWPPESRLGRSPASCGRQGRSPASCGRLGASGPQRAVWAALRRPVAVRGGLRSQGKGTEAENGLGAEIERRIFERSRHFGKHGSAHLYKLRLSGWFASILVATTRLRLALTTALVRGRHALHLPKAAKAAAKPSFPALGGRCQSGFAPPSASGAGRQRPLRPCGLLVRRCA